jgi:hypothetical protein
MQSRQLSLIFQTFSMTLTPWVGVDGNQKLSFHTKSQKQTKKMDLLKNSKNFT